ncbi:uncharacterized protein METZ01_LOCUS315768 [marine metagenome]|uniref:Outer membrane lipoprotein-sorting protein n=1 Tax=marine metagenome TaxID=408172 RepID=A0A382NP00_9ZZZZ
MFLSSRSRLILVVLSIIGTNFFAPVSSAQSKVEQLLNKLDENYYYPQKKGLVRISSQLQWEQENIGSKKIFAIKKPDFIFEGEFDGKTFRKRIKSYGIKKNTSEEEVIESIKFLNNYLDAFFPKTLREKFVHYKGIIGFRGASEIRLLLKKTEPTDDFNEYELFIDKKKWRISKIIVRQNQDPKKVEGKFFYAQKDEKWVVAETLSSFEINGHEFIEKTKYKYRAIESLWLVHEVNQTVKQDGNMILSYRFNLNDHKLRSKQ